MLEPNEAQRIVAFLRQWLSLVLTDQQGTALEGRLRFSSRWTPGITEEEWLSLLYLELSEENAKEDSAYRTVVRAIDRVAKRIAREKRSVAIDLNQLPAGRTEVNAGDVVLRFIEYLASYSSVREAMLFQRVYVDGASLDKVAAELGWKKSAAYEAKRKLRDKFLLFMRS